MFERFDLIKSYFNSSITKKRVILQKILVMNQKKIFPLYAYNMDFFFEDIKRSKETYKIKSTKSFYSTFKKLLYCMFAYLVSKKRNNFEYFLIYSVSNDIIKNRFTNIFKDVLFRKINKKKIITKYLIGEQPKKFWNFTYEHPLNFNYLYLYCKSKFRYFFLSKKYKSQKTKQLVINALYKDEQYVYWKKYFKKNRPRLIFVIDKISNFPVIKAANELKIISYEIQHGSPLTKKDTDLYKIKIAGKFCNNQSWFSSYKPDYYLCLGKFWEKNIDRNNYKRKIINIGVDIGHINKNQNIKSGILILSELVEFDQIKKLFKKFDEDKKKLLKIRFHPVIKKLPGEIELFLKKNNIEYSLGCNVNINNDLENIDKVLGINSTLLFQLFERGYRTYFFDTKFFSKKYLIKDKKFFNLSYLNKKYQKYFFYSNKNKISF